MTADEIVVALAVGVERLEMFIEPADQFLRGSRATVLRSKRMLVMLQGRLEMNEKFSHGGDDGAFVGFAAGEEALDVLAKDGVVLRRALGGHVQRASHLAASAADGTFAFPLAAVAIPRGQPG